METRKQIPMAEIAANFRRTGVHKDAIFSGRKPLMEELYASGIPIYCDQSYYVHEKKVDRVEKVGEHFKCDGYETFEDWRECHYYSLCEDANGNQIWLMTGGRFD